MDDVCLKAAELIENNFTTGAFIDNDGRMCMLGALQRASGLIDARVCGWGIYCGLANNDYRPACDRLKSVIPSCSCEGGWFDIDVVVHYNDYHCDGGVEAAKLLREAAEVE